MRRRLADAGHSAPGRGRGAPVPGSPSAPDGAGEVRREGAQSPGRSAAVRERPGAARGRRRERGRNENARQRPAESPPGPDTTVQALNLRIRELLDRHALNDRNADLAFNFTRENTVRRVYVTDAQRRGLAGGELAIVGFRRRHHIVPAAVADEIRALRSIVFVHRAAAAGEVGGSASVAPNASTQDDPYRDFPVPDDLHW